MPTVDKNRLFNVTILFKIYKPNARFFPEKHKITFKVVTMAHKKDDDAGDGDIDHVVARIS